MHKAKFDKIVDRRHPEWTEHQIHWRFMLDSYEGGERYRQAAYGADTRNLPVRNLIRHKREYPDPREQQSGGIMGVGADPASSATSDDYEMRRARTPVPTFVADAIDSHLSPIYCQEVKREHAPQALVVWWEDIDGKGAPIDDWMGDTFAPLLLTLGQLDVLMDRPRAPKDAEILTRADEGAAGLDSVVASIVLPENMLWWKLNAAGSRYEECLVREYCHDDGPKHRIRHWTATESTLYDHEGKVVEVVPHDYGQVPIRRFFDRRKARCENIGQSRYVVAAECQREYYNRDSELILSDTTQAHPLLQGPEDYVQADGTIPIGPGWLLPKKKNSMGGSATYEGFDVIDFPKGAAESIRLNKRDIRDTVDRSTHQTKPAGISGMTGDAVSQSGVSKRLDQAGGNQLLGKLARVLAKAERGLAELALIVLGRDPAEAEAIDITYPSEFDLFSIDELLSGTAEFQALMASSGDAPIIEADLLSAIVRQLLPGKDDEKYKSYDDEIKSLVETNGTRKDLMAEASMTSLDGSPPTTNFEEIEDGGTDGSSAAKSTGGNAPGKPTDGPGRAA